MLSFRSVYRKLLLLYPEQYRKKYGAQIIQTMEDMLANEPRAMQRIGILMKEIILLPGNILEQHMVAIARRGSLTANVLIGFIALALLLPFFIAMIADEMAERFYSQHLYNSWFWSKPVLTIWVIALPLLSLFISLSAYILLLFRAKARAGRTALQIKKTWLIMIVGLVSLLILFIITFHDSAQCWLNSSDPTITRLNKVIQCTETRFLNSDKK